MPKQVVSDVFETLGGAAVGTAKKTAEELGLKPAPDEGKEVQPSLPAQTPEQWQKIKEAAKSRAAARYRQIQEEIRLLQQKRKQELPKQVIGKPGFSEEKAVRQLEEKKEEEKKLPPLPAQRASRKTEMFRGVSG